MQTIEGNRIKLNTISWYNEGSIINGVYSTFFSFTIIDNDKSNVYVPSFYNSKKILIPTRYIPLSLTASAGYQQSLGFAASNEYIMQSITTPFLMPAYFKNEPNGESFNFDFMRYAPLIIQNSWHDSNYSNIVSAPPNQTVYFRGSILLRDFTNFKLSNDMFDVPNGKTYFPTDTAELYLQSSFNSAGIVQPQRITGSIRIFPFPPPMLAAETPFTNSTLTYLTLEN